MRFLPYCVDYVNYPESYYAVVLDMFAFGMEITEMGEVFDMDSKGR